MTDLVKELLPCPCCGGTPKFNAGEPWVECTQCGLQTAIEESRLEAANLWNRRAAALDRPVDGEREELAKWCDKLVELYPGDKTAGRYKRIASLLRTPPAEPSEAQIKAAAEAMWGPNWDHADWVAMQRRDLARAALIAAGVTGRPGVDGLLEALKGFNDDYMTSEQHHPGYVLIPTAKFEQIREAIANQLEPSA